MSSKAPGRAHLLEQGRAAPDHSSQVLSTSLTLKPATRVSFLALGWRDSLEMKRAVQPE